MQIGNQLFEFGKKTYIMGILNVTPDSFSDGGRYNQLEQAFLRAKQMVEDGADIIDIGGESTRPGHEIITVEEEIRRTVPVIERIARELNIPISIDTSKAEVAHAALSAGAHMVNDVWGLKKDVHMAKVIAKFQVPCCLMHNRGNINYIDIIQDMMGDLQESIQIAKKTGIAPEKIILDPGIGFAKSLQHNLIVMNQLERFKELGFPLLLGVSRKSVIGLTLNLPVDQRLEGTLATTVIGVMKGYGIIRVHDVLENKRAAQMADAIVYS